MTIFWEVLFFFSRIESPWPLVGRVAGESPVATGFASAKLGSKLNHGTGFASEKMNMKSIEIWLFLLK